MARCEIRAHVQAAARGTKRSYPTLGDDESSEDGVEQWVAQADGSFSLVSAALDLPALKRVHLEMDQLELRTGNSPLTVDIRPARPTSGDPAITTACRGWGGENSAQSSVMPVDTPWSMGRARGPSYGGVARQGGSEEGVQWASWEAEQRVQQGMPT